MKRVMPLWLSISLIVGCLISIGSVSMLVLWTAEAYLERPLLGGAADNNPVAVGPIDGELVTTPIAVSDPANLPAPQVAETVVALQQAPAETERVTILVMGIDRRPGEPFVSRTDTMILMTIDPAAQSAAMVSVPRDWYADIPGWGRDRVNTAFAKGAREGGAAGGAALAMQTVSYNLGVPIDHYLAVDFSAVVNTVDLLGGITVDVPFTINDPTFPDMNYGYDPLYIAAGRQQFDGETALKYARTRHVDNDFGRAQRQQQVILAVRDRVLTMGVDQFLAQLPTLYAQFEEGIRTDLSLGDIAGLATAAQDLPPGSIETAVLDYDYFNSYTTYNGASVLVLENEKVAPLIQDLFFD